MEIFSHFVKISLTVRWEDFEKKNENSFFCSFARYSIYGLDRLFDSVKLAKLPNGELCGLKSRISNKIYFKLLIQVLSACEGSIESIINFIWDTLNILWLDSYQGVTVKF